MQDLDVNKRLIFLDALRGFTIALMIMVNNPGSWSYIYWPLAHAEWHGVTITDFVFPFFLFIVGVSIVLSTDKLLSKGLTQKELRKKIGIRSLKIFGLGIFLSLYPKFNIYELRIPGVLQRIAIVYFICGHLNLICNWKLLIKIGVALLIGYWLLMLFVPIPHIGAGFLEPGKNLAAYIDSILIPGRLWQGTWDPEGLLSTMPAIVTGITGMLAGYLLKISKSIQVKLNYMFLIGFLMILVGYFWDLFFPMNKNLWTSSYVMFTSGWAMLALASSIFVVDVLGYKKATKFGVVYGSNAITIFVLAGMLPFIISSVLGLQSMFFDGLVNLGISPKLASFLWAIGYVLILYIPAYILYKKKIFIKV